MLPIRHPCFRWAGRPWRGCQ